MTLLDLVVYGGIILALAAIAVSTSLWPFGRRRALCLKAHQDADCERACLRSCPLEQAID